jgi:glycosyltransferase involved in cell wall biosynthesis
MLGFGNHIMNNEKTEREIKVITVIPAITKDKGMIFCEKETKVLIKAGINIKRFLLISRTNPLIIVKEFIRLCKEIKKNTPNIIHAHYGTMTSFLCCVVSLITRLPLIITFHGSDINKTSNAIGFWRDLLGKIFSQLSVLRATRIICVAEHMKENLWWGKNKTDVIPTGVNLNMFIPMIRDEARRLLNWNLNYKFVLFNAGKNPKVKRLDMAQSVINESKKHLPYIQFEVLSGDVEYEKIPLYLNAADCLLITSDSEGSPDIAKEALSCNLPIVSVDVGDIKERLKGVFLSKIVNRNIKEISNSIIEILLLNKRSNGRIIIEELSEEKIAQKIIDVYRTILNKNS